MQKRIKTQISKGNFRNSLIYHRKNKLDHKLTKNQQPDPQWPLLCLRLRHIMTNPKDQKLNSWKKSQLCKREFWTV